MIEIPLSLGLVAQIDDNDLPLVEGYAWSASPVPGHDLVYAIGWVSGRMAKMHRVIAGASHGVLVDHRNHNGLDNRRSNLRVCTPSQNGGNSRSRSGYKGVSWHGLRRKWRAEITVNRQKHHLGLFGDPWDAAQAYNAAALAAWGEFAHLNTRKKAAA